MTAYLAKPPFPVLQRDHPLADGLIVGLPLTEQGTVIRDIVAGVRSNANAPAWAIGAFGREMATGNGSVFAAHSFPALNDLTTFTVTAVASNDTFTGEIVDFADIFGWSLHMDDDGFAIDVIVFNADYDTTDLRIVSENLYPASRDIHAYWVITVVRTGTTARMWINGRETTYRTQQDGVGTPSSTSGHRLGIKANQAAGSGVERCTAVWIHDRALTDYEVRRLSADPFALVRPRRNPALYHVPAAGGGTSVTPDPVSATWSVAAPTVEISNSPAPVEASFSAPAPATALSITPDPVVATWSVPAPSVGGVITVTPDPVVMAFTVPTPALAIAAAVDAVSATWSIVGPTTVLTRGVQPVELSIDVAAPTIAIEQNVDPVAFTMTPVAPATAMELVVSPVVLTMSVVGVVLEGEAAPPLTAVFSDPYALTAIMSAPHELTAEFSDPYALTAEAEEVE